MANFRRINFIKFMYFCGMCTTFLAEVSDCRPANVPGSTTQTRVTHFTFFAKIANPCEIAPAPEAPQVFSQVQTFTTSPASTVSTTKTQIDFYETLLTELDLTLGKLRLLESADPSLPECNGISLDSLPGTPMLDNMNEAETIKQTYQTGIYLTTHLHLMALDRQLTVTGNNVIPDDQLQENVPSWRFLRCGNESESFPNSLQEVTSQMENILCTILTSATDEQRASFREPFNRLGSTVLYRYHTSCSTLQTRDCLVVREAKQALTLIQRKFTQLIADKNASAVGIGGDSANDDMDNSL